MNKLLQKFTQARRLKAAELVVLDEILVLLRSYDKTYDDVGIRFFYDGNKLCKNGSVEIFERSETEDNYITLSLVTFRQIIEDFKDEV